MYKLLIFISGTGTNLEYIINSILLKKCRIVGVISNRKNAYGLTIAENNNIPTHYFPYFKNKESRSEYDTRLAKYIKNNINHDLIVLAGWMHVFSTSFLENFNNIINLHPALPNTFPGKNAIEDAYRAFKLGKIKKTGAMIHRVTPIIDVGEIIKTIEIPILKTDSINDLKIRVKKYEKELLIMGIQNLMECNLHKVGKVRDIYTTDNSNHLVFYHSDRLSSFDRAICNVNGKGNVLMNTSIWWMNKTKHIVDNHYVNHYKNYMLVKKCNVIPLEFIVRGYITGSTNTSLWTHYNNGARNYCGIDFPDGLKKNQKLESPVLTPTTKDDVHDELISIEQIIERGILNKDQLDFIRNKALELYTYGAQVASESGLILVDTKYEFGIDDDGNIMLIDEIHTCDSSRYWYQDTYQHLFESGKEPQKLDKDNVRDYVKKNCDDPYKSDIPIIPEECKENVYKCYAEVHRLLSGETLTCSSYNHDSSDYNLLVQTLMEQIKVVIFSGSEVDRPHVEKIISNLDKYNISSVYHVCSAHKYTQRLLDIMKTYNDVSGKRIIFVTVAGRSNALSGVVACNTHFPVIACPPFKDKVDMMVNINSTLQCPSFTPVMTILEPNNVALSIKKIFNLF